MQIAIMPREKDTPKAAEDVEMTDAQQAKTNSTKRKKTTKHTTLSQFTIRNPAWAYIHLSLILASNSEPSTLDPLTAQLQLQSALSSFLGLHGTAIPIDFLNINGHHVWLRVPREDVSAFVAAMGSWVGKNGQGWTVNNWGCWGPDMGRNSGADLFDT